MYEVASSVVQVPFPFVSRGWYTRAAAGPRADRRAPRGDTHAARRGAYCGVARDHNCDTARAQFPRTSHVRSTHRYGIKKAPTTRRPPGAGGVHADTREGTWTYIGPPKASAGARGGRIRPCVLWWKCTRLRPRADRRSGAVGRSGAAGPRVRVCGACRCARVVAPLLPRMKASPYLALSCPFTYSSVCSIAMFMKPSRHASTPAPRHGKLSGRQGEQGTEAGHLGSPRQS